MQCKRERWIKAIRKHQDFQEVQNIHTICELHFAKEHIVNKRLKYKMAVPTIFEPE